MRQGFIYRALRTGCSWMLIAAFVACASSNAAEIASEVSTRETFVGLPITFRINVNNAIEHDTPILPEVDGLKIQQAGPPSRSSRTMWINNRKTHRTTVTYAFEVTPLREGVFTIPPIKVVADGLSSITKAIRVVATKSETDDLLFVEISGDKSKIYVGQSLDLTLRIWVRPYRNTEYRVDFDEGETWQTISKQTSWGIFRDRLEELAQNRSRPRGRRVLREDSDGQERQYLLYEIRSTIYPDRPTTIDGQDVQVIVNYPLELGRSRSPFANLDDAFFGGSPFDSSMFGSFGSRLRVTKHRPVVDDAAIEPITVMPIPTQGRPSDYVGAVGQYSIVTEASPTSLKVGDPITLRIGIDGNGSMDVVRAPPLAIQQSLTNDFRVPDEPLAGFVDGSRKVFSTTLRPLRDDIIEIPPIEYSYFDPEAEEFVRIKSRPIKIDVEPADLLALDAIIGGRNRDEPRRTQEESGQPTERIATPLFEGDEALVAMERSPTWSPLMLGCTLAPPIIFLLFALFANRGILGAWIPARRILERSIERAESSEDVGYALERYLAAVFQLPETRTLRDQTIGSLRATGRSDLAIRAERIYQDDETSNSEAMANLKAEAIAFANDFATSERRTSRSMSLPIGSRTTAVVLLSLGLASITPPSLLAAPLDLSNSQRQRLLAEATSLSSLAIDNPDKIEAMEQNAEAAEKFQLLIDSGLVNDHLYSNLAEVSLRSKQIGRSIANYRRALRLDPNNQAYLQRLAAAEAMVEATPTESGTLSKIAELNRPLMQLIPPFAYLLAASLSWIAFWSLLTLRLFNRVAHWKLPAFLALGLSLILGAAYWLHVSQFTRDDTAILLNSPIVLREGDGDEFPELARLVDREGDLVHVLGTRGEWIHISDAKGQRGWINSSDGSQI